MSSRVTGWTVLRGCLLAGAAIALLAGCDDNNGGGGDGDTDLIGSDTGGDTGSDTGFDTGFDFGSDGSGGVCTHNPPGCFTDLDCPGDSHCGFGPPCLPSSCCTYPDGSTACSGDCVPMCTPNEQLDADFDGIPDHSDNCPGTWNPDQADRNGNGVGDACEGERCEFNTGCEEGGCPPNSVCSFAGGECLPSMCCFDEGSGEAWCTDDCVPQCVPVEGFDRDQDGILDDKDNCPGTYNPEQRDSDGDGVGDACEETVTCETNPSDCASDADCPAGTACSAPPGFCEPTECCFDGATGLVFCTDDCRLQCLPLELMDRDGDGVPDTQDNCLEVPNPDQADGDGDGIGDACDESECFNHAGCQSHGQCAPSELCDANACAPSSCCTEPDGTVVCDDDCQPACVPGPDGDGDGRTDLKDNCPQVANAGQQDFDHDGVGDACDASSCVFNRRCLDDAGCGLNQVCDTSVCAPSTCCFADGQLACTGDCNAICVLGSDADHDGVTDTKDNCPQLANPGQADSDGDGTGDACDQP